MVTTLLNIPLPLDSSKIGHNKNILKNYLIGLVIFRRRILEAINYIKTLLGGCNKHMDAQQNNLYIVDSDEEEKENIFPSPPPTKKTKLC